MDRLKKKIPRIVWCKKNEQMSIHSKSAFAIASACTALLPTRSTIRSCGQSNAPIFQNYQLVWLDTSIDELNNRKYRNTVTILRYIVNNVNTFIEVDECVKFIGSIKEEKIFMIVSGTFVQITMPVVHDMPQIISIYIFCENKLEHELWMSKWPKIKGIFMEISFLCEALKQAAEECDRNTISMSFIETNDTTSDQSLDKLDKSFMCTRILKEIVLTIDFNQQDINEFITYYRKQIVDNVAELRNVEKLEREYHEHEPIWWYTYQCFLYSMLNRALRTMEVETIIKMGFFICKLHQQISQLHSKQNACCYNSTSFIVYRSQGMSQTDFDQLKKCQGGLLSFNNFLFTSKNRQVSLESARQTVSTSNLIGILFVMKIDPSIVSTPFANIRDVSYYPTEEEILFSIHSVFRIGQIKQINNHNTRLWQVELTLTSDDDDSQLHTLTKRILEETLSDRKGWCRLSDLLIKQRQLNKAQQVCNTIITQTADDDEKGFLYYQLGLIKFYQEEYSEANSFYNSSLEIRQKILPYKPVDVAVCYNQIGLVYEKMEEYSKALSSFEKAFEIYETVLPANDSFSSNCTNNIGRIYCQIGEYPESLLYYEKTLEIHQNTLSVNHPEVAITYNSIGSVYKKMGEYAKALTSFENSLAINKKIFPSNHPVTAESYLNIGSVYEKMQQYSIALSYYEKSLEIYEETLPSNHPNLAASHNNIGLIYFQRRDYVKALAFHEKAHEIYLKILPSNHPDLAASYVYYGAVYERMGKYTKALLYYKKAFEIYRNIYPLNYLGLANTYYNISSMYFQMGEYTLALTFNQCALDIEQRSSHLQIIPILNNGQTTLK